MGFYRIKKDFLVGVTTCAFLLTSLTPVTAGLFSFTSNRSSQEKLHSKIKDQVSAYNEEAIKLFEEGRFEEAQKLWETAIQIMERPKDHIEGRQELRWPPKSQEDQDLLELQKSIEKGLVVPKDEGAFGPNDVDQLYETAVSLFKQQKYVASKRMFNQIEGIVPDYKATRNYLTILEHKIKRTQQTLSEGNFKQRVVARQKERAEWRRILYESEQELKQRLSDQVDPLYKEALGFYRKREFTLARDYFNEVNRVLPGYKDAAKYLFRIDEDVAQEERRLVEERRKKRILTRKKEKKEWKRILEESERELQKRLAQQAEPVYRQAESYYKDREFELAKEWFEEVQWIFPRYKSTKKYLDRIDEDIRQDALLLQARRARELEQKQRENELARKREEKRLVQIREDEEERRLSAFQKEVSARRKEREEWLKVLEKKEKERQRKIQEQARLVYKEAVGHYRAKQFQQAKENFLEVQKLLPDYKSTKKYLAQIDTDIQEEEKRYLAEQQKMFQKRMHEKKIADIEEKKKEEKLLALKEERRIKEFQQKALARQKQREEWERVIQENELRRKQKLEEEAEFIYKEALRSYKDRRWESARSDLLVVQEILPGYKLTEKYLLRIDEDIKNDAQERKEAEYREIQRQRQREVLVHKREEERQIKKREAEHQKQIKDQERQAAAVYKFATSLYKRREYEEAREKFVEVNGILPDYKLTAKYLAHIDRDITEAWEQRQKEQQIALKRQFEAQQQETKREVERLRRQKKREQEKHLAQMKKEALAREQERKEWAQTIGQIEEDHQKRLQQQAEAIYTEALRYFRAGWLKQARETFQEVDMMSPGYKATAKYLSRIDGNIKKEDQLRRVSEEKIRKRQQKEEKLARERREEWQARLLAKKKELNDREREEEVLARQAENERVKKEMAEAEMEHQQRLEEKTERLYRRALKYYKVQEYERAQAMFVDVGKMIPGYESTDKYLARIDRNIQKETKRQDKRQRREADRLAREEKKIKLEKKEIELVSRRQEEWRKRLLQKKKELDAKKREEDVLEGRARKERLKKKMAQIEAEHKQRLAATADQLYFQALKRYKAGEHEKAKAMFIDVSKMIPEYESTEKYLTRIDRHFQKESKRRNEKQRREVVRLAKIERIRRGKERRELEEIGKEARVREAKKEQFKEDLAQIEGEHQRRLKKQTDDLYRKALVYYKTQAYEQAKIAFIGVEKTLPGYKSTEKYLARIDRDIERHIKREPSEKPKEIVIDRVQEKPARKDVLQKELVQKRLKEVKKESTLVLEQNGDAVVKEASQQRQKEFSRETEGRYREAMAFYKAKAFIDAKLKFIEVESFSPGYKATLDYLSRIDRDISENPEMIVEQEADRVFQQGVAFYKSKKYKEAKAKLAEADRLRPGDKSTLRYLKKTRKKVATEQRRSAKRAKTESKPQARVIKEKIAQETRQRVAQKDEVKTIDRKDIIAQALLQVEKNALKSQEKKPSAPIARKPQQDMQLRADVQSEVNQRREELKFQRSKVRKEYDRQFKQMYTKAVKLYRAGSYEEARAMFLQIQRMKPGYKKASSYFKKAEAKIRKGLQKKESSVVLQPKETKGRDTLVEEALNAVEQTL